MMPFFKKHILIATSLFAFVLPSCSTFNSSSFPITSNGDNSFRFDTLMNPGDEERCIYKYSNDEVVERKVSYYQSLVFNDKEVAIDKTKLSVKFNYENVKYQILVNSLFFDAPTIIFRVTGKTNSIIMSVTYKDFSLSKEYQVLDRSVPSFSYYQRNLFIPGGGTYLKTYEEYESIIKDYPEAEPYIPSWLKNKDNYVDYSYLIYAYSFNNGLPEVENVFIIDNDYLILNLNVNIMNFDVDPTFANPSSYIIKFKKGVNFSRIGVFNSHNFSEIN